MRRIAQEMREMKWGSHRSDWRKRVWGGGSSLCKGPGECRSLLCLWNSEEAGVDGGVEVTAAQIPQDLMVRTWTSGELLFGAEHAEVKC